MYIQYVYKPTAFFYNTSKGDKSMELLGNKIRMLRINKNITQEELAQKLSVSSQAVSKWERSISSPDITLLPVIARYFGITLDELFNYRLDALTYKERFIRFMADNDVLRFGEFKLKSGRISPYFITTERYSSGSQLTKIGEFYAECIRENNIRTNLLLANTYKEIHIITAVCMIMYMKYGVDINYCINNTVGKLSAPYDEITVIKDTLASGDTLRSIMQNIKECTGKYPSNVVLSVDRAEKGLRSPMTTAHEIQEEFGVRVYSTVTVDDIICALENGVIAGSEHLKAMKEYREQYRGK